MPKLNTVNRNGKSYIWANNLILSNPAIKDKEFSIRYKSPSGAVSEKVVIPNDSTKKEDIKAIHELWWALKEMMQKAHPENDLNPYKIINKESYRNKVRFQGDPQQLELDFGAAKAASFSYILDVIANTLEEKGALKQAYVIDRIANTIDETKWQANESNLFWDEIQNKEIAVEKVKKVLDMIKDNIDKDKIVEESKLSKEDIDDILKIAKKFKLIKT